MAFAIPPPRRAESLRQVERLLHVLTGPLGALGIALALALLCGLFVESRSLALAGAFVAILLLGLWYPWLAVRAVTGSVEFDSLRLREGESATATIRLENHRWLPVLGLQVEGILPSERESTLLVGLRGRESRALVERGEALLRGVYPSQPPQLTCCFPFGLITARRPLSCRSEVVVWPRCVPVPDIPDSGSAETHEGGLASRQAGTSGDLIGVRDYRRGDALRRIHWAQTARHERLIVTERQALRLPRIHLTLDLTQAQSGVDSEREWAIRITLSIAEKALRQGVPLELTVCDNQVQRFSGSLQRYRDVLARLPWEPSRARYVEPPRVSTPAALRILVTTAGTGSSLGGDLRADLIVLAERGGVPTRA